MYFWSTIGDKLTYISYEFLYFTLLKIYLVFFLTTYTNSFFKFAILIEVKVDIVCENNMIDGLFVSIELFLIFSLAIKITFANVLGFKHRNCNLIFDNSNVWFTTYHQFLLTHDVIFAIKDVVEEILQRGSVGQFAGFTRRILLVDSFCVRPYNLFVRLHIG